jgi:outer membrane receptor protein involved in Fe transport
MRLFHGGFLAAFLATTALHAQGSGSITGTVTAADTKAPITGARVAVDNPARVTGTDDAGRFVLRGLPDGSYDVSVSAMGRAPQRQRVTVSGGGVQTLDVALAPGSLMLSAVMVSGTTAPIEASKVAATVNFLSPEQVRTSPARGVQDLLREIPGIEMPRTSSSVGGTAQIVSVRGVDEGRTAVLVDGIPINDAWGEWIDWDRVSKSRVERVEVFEGGASSLYGNGAMGGVISLFTRPAAPGSWRAAVDGGSRDMKHGFASAAVPLAGPFSLAVSGDYADGGGYKLIGTGAGPVDTVSSSIRRSANARLDFAPSALVTGWVSTSLFNDDRKLGTPLSRARRTNGSADAGVDIQLENAGAVSARAWDSEMREDQWATTLSTVSGVARALERTTGWAHIPSYDRGLSVGWRKGKTFGFQSVSAGADYRYYGGFYDEQLYANTAANGPTTHTTSGGNQTLSGLYVSGTLTPAAALQVELSARVDQWNNNDGVYTDAAGTTHYQNASRNAFSPRIGAKYRFTDALAAHVAAYQAFRAPNLAELYRKSQSSTAISLPNPELKPEFATGTELGLDWQPTHWAQVKGTIYAVDYRDFNTQVTISAAGVTPSTRKRLNVQKAHGLGGELYVALRPRDALTLSASGNYIDNRITDMGAATPTATLFKGARVARVPFSRATVRAAYDSKAIGLLSLVGRYEGTNTTFGNSFTLPDFGVLDASLSRGIIAGLDGFVSVENVFDRAYTVSLAGTATAPIITVGLPRTLRIGLEVYRH